MKYFLASSVFGGILLIPTLTLGQTLTQTSQHSAFTSAEQLKSGFSAPQGTYRDYDASLNFAAQANGAAGAVAKDTIPGLSNIHDSSFANDGSYGNGASWISDSSNSWIKIDLGRSVDISSIAFGRDRLGYFDDRDPGQFTIEVASADNVYATGDSSNDSSEYQLFLDSSTLGFGGLINLGNTLVATSASPMTGRFVKLTFASVGVAVDEVEVFGSVVPEPATVLSLSVGSLFVAARRRKRN